MTDALSTFIQPPEGKTLDGACEALHLAVTSYVGALKSGLGRKTKDNSEWKRVITKYYGTSRLSSDKWDEVCARVRDLGVLGIEESDGGREYWKPLELETPELETPEKEETKEPCVETPEPETKSKWDYDPDTEPEEDTWGGFTEEELALIEILNMAYLRGHTLYEQGVKPSFYDAHRWALVHGKPLAVGARLRLNAQGQSFGYCHDADGRYTGGLCNCAVMSADQGCGILSKEEKATVREACIQPCPNCPNKRWAKRGSIPTENPV